MVLKVAHVSWPLAPTFIVCKWSDYDCGFRMVLMVSSLSWTLAFSFIEGKWSDYDLVIQDCADLDNCPSVLVPYFIIHRK